MNSLFEDPKLIIFVGVIAVAVLASILTRTARYKLVLSAMVGVLLITIAGVVLERVVVTEKEKVEATIDGAAAALEDNDVDRVLYYISESADRTRTRAEWSLEQIEVIDTKIRNLEIIINELTSPPTAEARFDGVIYYRLKVASTGREWYPAQIFVELRRENGRWLITDHVEHETRGL